jgi:hypothetical protein
LATAFFFRRARLLVPLQGPETAIHGVLTLLAFATTVVTLLARADFASPVTYALPISAAAAVFLHVYRDHLGHEENALRVVPPLVATVACLYEAFTSTGLGRDLVALAVGLVLIVMSRRWIQISHLVLGCACVLLAGVDLLRDRSIGASVAAGDPFRIIPLVAIVVAAMGMLVIRIGPRLFVDPAEFRPPVVRACLALATLALGLTLVVGPVAGVLDVALAACALAAVAGLALYFAFFERLGWPLLVAGATPVLAFTYLRARTDWLDQLHRWDALVAIAAGLLLLGVERLVCRAGGTPVDLELAAPDEVPFGVAEIRLGTAFVMCLSAVAFLDLHGPVDAIGPVLAALFFLRRARRETPIYGVLALLFLNVALLLFLVDRHVGSAIAYVLPPGASIAFLMHVYRDHLGYEANSLRVLPPVAVGAVCLFEALNSSTIVVPTLALAGVGLALLLTARLWHLRAHLPLGLGCLAAALLTVISYWNSHGWTMAAIALGIATLLVPTVLLRWR